MPTFGQLAKGKRARKTFDFPMPGTKVNFETGGFEGETIKVDVRPLSEPELFEVLDKSRAFAKARGVEQPEEGDPIYDEAIKLHTVALACIDSDSLVDAPAQFFDGGVSQILENDTLQREHIAFLYEQARLWQEECSPTRRNMTRTEYTAALVRTAGGDMTDFLGMSPGQRWSFMRSMAAEQLILLARKSTSSSPSDLQPS